MLRQSFAFVLFASTAAFAQYPQPGYAPPAPQQQNYPVAPEASLPWLKVAELPPGTQIVVHQRGYNWPIQCTLAWINPKALGCDTTGTPNGSQRLTIPATSVESVQLQSSPYAPQPAPIQSYSQPVYVPPLAVYGPPPPVYIRREHHDGAIVFFGGVAGGLIGGLIGKNFGTGAGFTGAALGGLAGIGIALGADSGYNHYHP